MTDPAQTTDSPTPRARRSWSFAKDFAYALSLLGFAPSTSSSADDFASGRAALYFPILGLAAGILLAIVDRFLLRFGPVAASIIVIAISITAGRFLIPAGIARMTTDLAKLPRVLAMVFATTIVLVEILVLSSVRHPAGRARAIVLALMLSRWTMLPVAYGLRVTDENGLGARWRGGVTFTEFSLSSIFALAVAMGLYDVIGLAAIIVSVILILLCRLFFSRVAGGISGYSMAASGQLCELLIFAVVATFRF